MACVLDERDKTRWPTWPTWARRAATKKPRGPKARFGIAPARALALPQRATFTADKSLRAARCGP
eukprot:1181772-Pyramimonas_sp.AAC.1